MITLEFSLAGSCTTLLSIIESPPFTSCGNIADKKNKPKEHVKTFDKGEKYICGQCRVGENCIVINDEGLESLVAINTQAWTAWTKFIIEDDKVGAARLMVP